MKIWDTKGVIYKRAILSMARWYFPCVDLQLAQQPEKVSSSVTVSYRRTLSPGYDIGDGQRRLGFE